MIITVDLLKILALIFIIYQIGFIFWWGTK